MKHNAYDVKYEYVQAFGKDAFFTTLRIDNSSIPSNLFHYEIREESGEPCQIGLSVFVNFYGTLVTKEPIELDSDGFRDIKSNDFYWLCSCEKSIEEIL